MDPCATAGGETVVRPLDECWNRVLSTYGANCSSTITTNDSPTPGSTSRSLPVLALRREAQLLHNLPHHPGLWRTRGIISNFFDST